MAIWCRHFSRDCGVARLAEPQPEAGYSWQGIYLVIPVGKCTVRKMRNVRSIPQCEVPPGRGGCRKFEPSTLEKPVFEYNPIARLWMRYLGSLGDPEVEAEAARIEGGET